MKTLRAKYIGNKPVSQSPQTNLSKGDAPATKTMFSQSPLSQPPERQAMLTASSSCKRSLYHSPTPRKVKRPLVFTPKRLPPILPKPVETEKPDENERKPKRKKISVRLFSPGKAVVLYSSSGHGDTVKSRKIPAGHYQRIVKNISQDNFRDRTSRIIYKSALKDSVNTTFFSEVKKECNSLCSKKNASLLRDCSNENLSKFSVEHMNEEIQRKAPLLHGILQQAVKGSVVGTVVAAVVALKFRNKQMSAVDHIISQVLDRGGATDETIDTLAKLGMCVSSSAMAKQKQKLLQRQQEIIENLLLKEKEALENSGRNENENQVKL